VVVLNSKNGVSFYQFQLLSGLNGLSHGIFTRNRGSSKAPFDSLNVGLSVGDERSRVIKNRALIRDAANIDRLFFLHQIHDRHVFILKADYGACIDIDIKPPQKADAVITDCKQVGLVIQVADCQSVMLYDFKNQVIANVHSGWRGSVKNIIGHTILKMAEIFGCNPSDILAGIGPSLGPCCAEFVNYRKEIPEKYWQYKTDTNHFDFWAISREQLEGAGVRSDNICASDICTRCNTGQFFSYRGEGVTGRFATVIMLH
jgi:polyphenol oxidase